MDDLKSHSEEEVIQLISKRWNGLQLLRKNLGDEAIDFKPYGGYELFLKDDEDTYSDCLQKLSFINDLSLTKTSKPFCLARIALPTPLSPLPNITIRLLNYLNFRVTNVNTANIIPIIKKRITIFDS